MPVAQSDDVRSYDQRLRLEQGRRRVGADAGQLELRGDLGLAVQALGAEERVRGRDRRRLAGEDDLELLLELEVDPHLAQPRPGHAVGIADGDVLLLRCDKAGGAAERSGLPEVAPRGETPVQPATLQADAAEAQLLYRARHQLGEEASALRHLGAAGA